MGRGRPKQGLLPSHRLRCARCFMVPKPSWNTHEYFPRSCSNAVAGAGVSVEKARILAQSKGISLSQSRPRSGGPLPQQPARCASPCVHHASPPHRSLQEPECSQTYKCEATTLMVSQVQMEITCPSTLWRSGSQLHLYLSPW